MALLSRRGVITGASAPAPSRPKLPRKALVRVLRYPDGIERRISYPVEEEEEPFQEPLQEASSLWGSSSWAAPKRATPERELVALPGIQPAIEEAPLTFSWSDIRRQATQLSERVRDSYQVLHGCPWPVPRPMFVLTMSLTAMDSSLKFFTLRTRTAKGLDFTDELARVLGDSALASSISLTDMQDGVVAFNNREQAERFAATMLDEGADTYSDVHICEVPSHELFRLAVGEAKACVVAVAFPDNQGAAPAAPPAPTAAGGTSSSASKVQQGPASSTLDSVWLPSPAQLAHSLRGPSAWEDGAM